MATNMLGFDSPEWIQGTFEISPENDALVEVALMRITENDASVFQKLNICGRMGHPGLSLPFKVTTLIRAYAKDIGNFLELNLTNPLQLLQESPRSRGHEEQSNCVLAIDAVRVLFNTAHLKHGPWRLPYLFGTRALKELHPAVDVDALIVREMRNLRVAYVHYCTGNDCTRLFSRSKSFWRLEYDTTYSTPRGAELMASRVGAMQAVAIAAGVQASKEELQVGKRRKVLWTESEDEDLVAGIRKHGFSNWKKIAMDPVYSFSKGSRSAVQLKDRERTLRKQAALAGVGVGVGLGLGVGVGVGAGHNRTMRPLAELDAIVAASTGGTNNNNNDMAAYAQLSESEPDSDDLPVISLELNRNRYGIHSEAPDIAGTAVEVELSSHIGEDQSNALHRYLEARRRSGGLFTFYCSAVFPGPRPNHPTAVARPSQDAFTAIRDALVNAGVLVPNGHQYSVGERTYIFI
jgi:hypothetical protein